MEELDYIYQNLIKLAFEVVVTVQQGVELIEAFDYLAKRNTIIQFVQRKADFVYSLFIEEMDKAKIEHEQMTKNISKELAIPMPIGSAMRSGVAIWTQSLIKRVEKLNKQRLQMTFINPSNRALDAREKYQDCLNYLKRQMQLQHTEWKKQYQDE